MGQQNNNTFGKSYYISQALLLNPAFKSELEIFKQQCLKVKAPIPAAGFNSDWELIKWSNKILKKTGVSRAIWLRNIIVKFLQKSDSAELHKLIKFLENTLLRNGVQNKINFSVHLQSEPNKVILSAQSPKEPGVYIKIFPYTTKDSIKNNWSYILRQAKQFPGWNKTKANTETLVIPVMQAFVKAKPIGIKTRSGFDRRRPKAIEKQIAKLLPKQYQTSEENIRRIIKKYRYLERYFN